MSAVMKNQSWFSHDSNAKDDHKCMLLIDQMGVEGYGIFWILVETLREQNDYRYPLVLIPSLARKYNTTQSKIEVVIANYGLFKIDGDDFFFSPSLNQRMIPLQEKREKMKALSQKGVAARKNKQEEQLKLLSQLDSTNSTVTKVKKSKEKKSKENSLLESREDFNIFRREFIQTHRGDLFFTEDIGYLTDTGFTINEQGLILNTVNQKILTREEALKVWDFLYKKSKLGVQDGN